MGPQLGTGESFMQRRVEGKPQGTSFSSLGGALSPCPERASKLAPGLCHANLQEGSGPRPTQPPPAGPL